jgi:streptomycin 6-kinase
MTIELPGDLASWIPTCFGDRGRAWIAGLPDLLADLCRRWDLTVTGPAFGGGTHSYVVPVAGAGRSDAVLKIPVLDTENYAESAALRCYAGDGAVRLYRADPVSGALLMERAGGEAAQHGYERGEIGTDTVIEVAGGLVRRLRRPPSGDLSCPAPVPSSSSAPLPVRAPDHPFPLVRETVERWIEEFPRQHEAIGRPLDAALFAETTGLLAELLAPDGPEVIVNRDAHLLNILAADREPWLVIDPKPMVGEAAFDGGHLLWDILRHRPTTGQARYLLDGLSEAMAVDRARLRAWCLVRTVDNLVDWVYDEGGDPGTYLAVAAALHEAGRPPAAAAGVASRA